ncbi:NUDIX domain-containing protein [bacterium SCSIO 12696]|nr:NUDIX domain-containing protein [bacterium SCSIO 12696]
MSLSEDLLRLRKDRVDGVPFETLIEFEEWADKVSPLLYFDTALKSSFEQSIISAKVTYRMGNKADSTASMNEAIGILNQAIVISENAVKQECDAQKKELLPPEKITISWLLDHVEVKHWVGVATIVASIFTAGMAFSGAGVYKNLKATLFPKEVNFVRATGALILGCNNKKPAMLGVLHDEDGSFVFSPPAGKSKEGESERATAIRETEEETGYTIIPLKSLGNSPKGNTNFSLVLAEVDKNKAADPHYHEVVGLLWANPKDIPSSGWRFPEQKEWIVELFEENAPRKCP